MVQIDVRKDGSEVVTYDYDGYYAYIRRGILSDYPNFTADSHWHDDLEFISVLSGSMDYNVNGEIIRLHAGQGVFVNARQLHYGFSNERSECNFYCVLLHPMLLCASQQIDRDFISPVLSNSSLPYVLLNSDVAWQRIILEDIEKIYLSKNKATAQLSIQSSFYHIWLTLIENTTKVKRIKKQDRNLCVLKDMIIFIQGNYTQRIYLEDIASAGNLSKSACLMLLKKYVHDTPVHYLISYRLKQAVSLLKGSKRSITEIAYDVGFDGVSYFAETFRKKYGYAPSEFRIKNKTKHTANKSLLL